MNIAADAQPDTSRLRLQVLLAARGGCRGKLADAARSIARSAVTSLAGTARVTLLTEIDNDPFPAANPSCRPFDVVLELQSDASTGIVTLINSLEGMAGCVADHAHLDLSGALVGAPQLIIACVPTQLRYLYLMRRKALTTHAAYIDYYFHHHSRFGFATPSIAGYTQFHVDAKTSTYAAQRLGLGTTCVDSVSELHLDSLESFLAGICDGRLGAEAGEDEALFVDRENSVSFVCVSEVFAS